MDVNVRMVAPSGTLCKIKMGSGVTSGFSISSQAQHGIASITESRIVYKSAAGFVGEDQFIYEKTGHSYDYHKDLPVDGLSHYIVSVEVVP